MNSNKRKFQVSNGYLFEFDQFARLLTYLLEHRSSPKIKRLELEDSTGLSNRQLESLVSIGSAVGLIVPGKQILTAVGGVIAKHDIFLDTKGSLEWCHYKGAGSFRNLIWFEIFNTIIPSGRNVTQDAWMASLRSMLAGKYTDRTIGKHLYEEVRFVADAYLERHFSKLSLLHRNSEGILYRRRYTDPEPLIVAAMLYDFGGVHDTNLLQMDDVINKPSYPGFVFGIDDSTMRTTLESIHENGWVRYEGAHNLDQIRLKPGYNAISFLLAYYTNQPPIQRSDSEHAGNPTSG